MKVAVIGQSAFGVEVYKDLLQRGHEIVGVFTIPDNKGREDPLATAASANGHKVFKFPRWKALKKDGGQVLPEVMEQYTACGAELNVLAFVTQFIPMEVSEACQHGSIVYHPSLLPRHRGASAINWTLMEGDAKAGLAVFWADEGLDTGPILLTRECEVLPDDTVNSLYKRFLFPEGIKAVGDAVDMVAAGTAPRIVQPEEGATYDPMWKDAKLARVDFSKTGLQIHNFIRGNDRVPGAWAVIDGQETTLYGSHMLSAEEDAAVGAGAATPVVVEGAPSPGLVTPRGLVLAGADGARLCVDTLKAGTRSFPAPELLAVRAAAAGGAGGGGAGGGALALSEGEKKVEKLVMKAWCHILGAEKVEASTDFFAAGAGSMDVTRLVEGLKDALGGGGGLAAEDVFMNPTFGEFLHMLVKKLRGSAKVQAEHKTVALQARGRTLLCPTQLFINGEFVDPVKGGVMETVNPATEEVLAAVGKGTEEDVDKAVAAAKAAFERGEWRKMSARERGKLLLRLADCMEAAREELAAIEALDSGAVFSLALKTHVGMSIETFRYFAGWCDKIQGKTIPISPARPHSVLCMAKREPIGVCGIIIPWNYPLMMLAWKAAACLAAGNTLVLKPAEVTPLSALKFAELSLQAGIPPGVINIVNGTGSCVGAAITEHPHIHKVAFTGSTGVGKLIMAGAARSNLKKVSLELGGKSPLFVFADADFDRAVRNACQAVFFNKGENCIAAGRVFVEESILERFVGAVVAEAGKIKAGDPFDPATSHGPQNHKAHMDKLLKYIETAKTEGAKLACGGKRIGDKGFFLEPTVFTDVSDDSSVAQEESFGPIMLISSFGGSVEEVARRANATEYGLASGVFTKDISKALRVSDLLEAGTVFVNTYNKTDVAAPFGGWKQSGFGKDLGEEALNDYLRTKVVTIEY